MSDYAGAKAAIRARLEANWTTTRITYENEVPDAPWPPVDADPDFPALLPWVHLEVAALQTRQRGAGVPGSQIWVTDGFIYVHVFVPANSAIETADQYAVTIGEIFRAKVFYNAGDGCYVRTWAPNVGRGEPGSDDGAYFRVSLSVPFEYWHLG